MSISETTIGRIGHAYVRKKESFHIYIDRVGFLYIVAYDYSYQYGTEEKHDR
jgi:hypothetical protein